ncbi:Trehalase [Fusarium albosuccineum]|uniref:Trehalase n=1 Tax=Fusarium albosuccineum TaxID=1237068 RepID=A0A8H4LEX5_9HYPO|nr:Trehalase [Fusarium albosuccineum]
MAALRHVAAALAASASAVSALYVNGSIIAPCDSPIYCHGDILEQVELARPFSDSKTFVDMPAIRPLKEIQEAFDKLDKPLRNNSDLGDFLDENFADAGHELEEVPDDELGTDPEFLDKIDDTVIKEFTEKVIDIWPDLTRRYNSDASNCTECPNSFIPINRTFVVAGGRFREPYYWDSYWILEGLLRTGGSFIEIAKNTIENFLDFVEEYGFVPNGARVYYLNRSQPPLLAQMVKIYIQHTNDTDILERALPLLVKEHEFWMTNRTVEVYINNETFLLNRYDVSNTRPRPESYREDYITANNKSYYSASGDVFPEEEKLSTKQKETLYSNLASGAESGWDYTARWIARPEDAARDNYFPLRYLNTRNMIPVDLNSILYGNEIVIADFYQNQGNSSAADEWREVASNRSYAMTAFLWNETHWSYFDYNLTSKSQYIYVPADKDTESIEKTDAPKGKQVLFSVSQFYPFWLGAAPDYIQRNPYAVLNAYKRVSYYLDNKAGGIPATNFRTSQQWDQPNVWPPLMHILMAGLQNVHPTFGILDPSFVEIRKLATRLGQRYLDSTFCTWYATGGSTSDTPQLKGLSDKDEGIMFEKYADNATNVAGGGGEYEVVEGFGWTNGVLIWAVDTFANKLKRPDCGDIEAADINDKRSLSAVMLHARDARRVKKFGRRKRAEKSAAKRSSRLFRS